ncbi:response regulator [Noviherbaspirillum sp. ST9]|uniref:response regulator n=1 Tax=Noviherbaspirillum sp. ST9 TaxID=3401606 RepID=UPI003B589FC5
MRRLLLIDDESHVLQALHRALRQSFAGEELVIEVFTDPEQALLRSGEAEFDVVVSDYRMPSMNGIDFLKMIKHMQPDAIRLVLSASTEFETVMQAINQAEVFRYIPKPWHSDELSATLAAAFVRHDELMEDRRLAALLRPEEGELTPQELEARRLEAEEPGITRVNWGEDGSVQLD